VSGWGIRAASSNDVAALSLIGSATFLESFAGILAGDAIVRHCSGQNSAERYQDYFSAGAKAWLGEAAIGKAPVGFALLTMPDLPCAGDGDIELKRIYTLSRFHGSGLGTALMESAIDEAKGFDRLLLGVYRDNPRAIAFYRKHGFELAGERRFEVGGTFYDDIVLARKLTA
jgi:ribosomal protein S18 acetylase RimI-like enzyme